jgi:hypothetical protein
LGSRPKARSKNSKAAGHPATTRGRSSCSAQGAEPAPPNISIATGSSEEDKDNPDHEMIDEAWGQAAFSEDDLLDLP